VLCPQPGVIPASSDTGRQRLRTRNRYARESPLSSLVFFESRVSRPAASNATGPEYSIATCVVLTASHFSPAAPIRPQRTSAESSAVPPESEKTRADAARRRRASSDSCEARPSPLLDQTDQMAGSVHAFDLFRTAVASFGYDRVAFVPVTPAAQEALGLAELAPAVSVNVPDEWVRHYMAENYQAFDPVLLQTPLQNGPLVWDEMLISGRLSPKQRRVLTESRDASLFNGVSIPLHGPRGETYVISLAAERATVPRPEQYPELQRLAAEFLIAYPRAKLRETERPDNVRITDRERECLTWTAHGKSAWTIGKILDVSEHTVNFHLKQCMAKLGVSNRMQAVVCALRLGLILP
jgi:DNA-binding CsgD family transcriptional regulator